MIESRLMIEVLGKPVDVLEKTLEKIKETIKERYKLLRSEILKPKKVEKTDIYSAVLEIEVGFRNFDELFSCILDFGPTFVEVLEPEEVVIKNLELQNVLSDLIGKLHDLSKAIQNLQIENIRLKKQIN